MISCNSVFIFYQLVLVCVQVSKVLIFFEQQEMEDVIMDIEIKNLSKQYGKKEAVKNFEATLTPGIWGLLGANGAGKTTLMRMMAGILEPSKGAVQYCGEDIRNNQQYRSEFGFLPQEIQFGKDLTVRNYLE